MEGSQIEPSKSYGDTFLQITRQMVAQYGGGLASKVVAPSVPAPASAPPAVGNNGCTFTLGFAALAGQIPSVDGGCKVNEHHNPANGDALQETSGGLLVWRKADNFTAFTDGYHTWVNGPFGVQERLNTEHFSWEG